MLYVGVYVVEEANSYDILVEFHDPDNIESMAVIEYELAFCSE